MSKGAQIRVKVRRAWTTLCPCGRGLLYVGVAYVSRDTMELCDWTLSMNGSMHTTDDVVERFKRVEHSQCIL